MRPEIVCPHCQGRIDLIQAAASEELVELVKLLYSLSGVDTKLVWRYLTLFRAKPDSPALPTRTVTNALLELHEALKQGWIKYERRTWNIDGQLLAEALERCLEAKPQALKNNNYLRKILADVAEKAGRQREAARNARAQTGTDYTDRPVPGSASAAGGEELPISRWPLAEAAAKLAEVESSPAMKRFGRAVREQLISRLEGGGVDIERLLALIATGATDGSELVRRCKNDNGMAQVGETLELEQ